MVFTNKNFITYKTNIFSKQIKEFFIINMKTYFLKIHKI
jgi:hypothetical protein